MTTPAGCEHVDHEMSQALLIAREFARCHSHVVGDLVWRAFRVAYCAHLRALMEFFHDGYRPTWTTPSDKDFRLSGFVPSPVGEIPWTKPEEDRLNDADKLLGHLSKGRRSPLGPPTGPPNGAEEGRASQGLTLRLRAGGRPRA